VLTAENSSVLNDLQAQGHAIGHIAPENLIEVLPQPPHSPHAAKLVVGLGTGFNACPVFDTEAGRFVPPSEAGHVACPSPSRALTRLIDRIGDSHGFPSVEEVLSGRGVSTLHAALHGIDVQPADILAGMAAGRRSADHGAALRSGDGACDRRPGAQPPALRGIYLVGGVSRAFAPWLDEFGFAEAFRAKGRFSGFMEQFGVQVVTDDYAALTGCASHLAKL
jgi:glucokinase